MTENQTETNPLTTHNRQYRAWWIVLDDGRVINTTGYSMKAPRQWWFPEEDFVGEAYVQCFIEPLDAVTKAIENEMGKVNIINQNLRKLQERREHLL